MEGAASTVTGVLSKSITSAMLQGIFDEIISLLPICLPVMIGFIGIRKGISFVMSLLHSA